MQVVERIQCGGFGAHGWWEKNKKRCKRINAEQWCEHCHKEMVEGTGWIVNWKYSDDSLYPIEGEKFEYRLLGNECIKNFLRKDQYAIYAKQVM
jgi:hypothetical protein